LNIVPKLDDLDPKTEYSSQTLNMVPKKNNQAPKIDNLVPKTCL
jgi:hypothetical protein